MADALVKGEDPEEQFSRLYLEHYPGLVAFFGRRGLDAEVSRELAQDVMLRAYQGLEHFDGRSDPRTWILRIATNLWCNWVRDHRGTLKRAGREDSLDEARESGLQIAERGALWRGSGSNPERRVLEEQARTQVRSRIPGLPQRQRQCLELWLEGRGYQEIADELGGSLQTVRATLHKAKARIVRELPEFRAPEHAPPGDGS